MIVAGGGKKFIVNIFFISLQYFSYQYQDDSIDVTIDTFK